MITLKDLAGSTRKKVFMRRKVVRCAEERTLPKVGPKAMEDTFMSTDYVRRTLQTFREGNTAVYKEVLQIIFIQMALSNGARCGEFRNIKVGLLTKDNYV